MCVLFSISRKLEAAAAAALSIRDSATIISSSSAPLLNLLTFLAAAVARPDFFKLISARGFKATRRGKKFAPKLLKKGSHVDGERKMFEWCLALSFQLSCVVRWWKTGKVVRLTGSEHGLSSTTRSSER